jgi:hypothetical protein
MTTSARGGVAAPPIAATCPVCESKLPVKGGTPRSLAQHKRYFAIIKAAFQQWPERDEFNDENDLRKYLQLQAGHGVVVAEIPLPGIKKEVARFVAAQAIKAAGEYAMPLVRGNNLRIVKPLSIAFDKMPHEEFCRLSDHVCAIIEHRIGVKVDDLIREHVNIV